METENKNAVSERRRPTGRKERKPRQEIHYTQPKPFYRKRLIVQLLSIAAVVLAVTIGISIFFKVDTITVTFDGDGQSKYSAATIVDTSDIQSGDSLLFFGRAGAASRIKKALPYVDTVRFDIDLPGTVNIIVTEKPVAYAVQSMDGSWWLMTADGMVVEKATPEMAERSPHIEGIILQTPTVGEAAVVAEHAGTSSIATAEDYRKAAIRILTQLETWELFDAVTKVDVSDLFALRLYCGEDYRVELGDSGDMQTKIGILKEALDRSELKGRSGVLRMVYDEEAGKWGVIYQPWSQQ